MAKKNSQPNTTADHKKDFSPLVTNEGILLVLLILSAISVGATNLSSKFGMWYWNVLVPVFGGFSMLLDWNRPAQRNVPKSIIIRNHLIHWFGLMLAITLIFMLDKIGQQTNLDTAFFALTSFALAVFLAGVHAGWRFCFLGFILFAAVACAELMEQYLWMMFLPLVAALAIGSLGVRMARKKKRAKGNASPELASEPAQTNSQANAE